MAYKLFVTIEVFNPQFTSRAITTNELSFGTVQERETARKAIERVHGHETNTNPHGTVQFVEYEASDPLVHVSTGNDVLWVFNA